MLALLNRIARQLLSPRQRFLAKHYFTRLRARFGISPSHNSLDVRALELLGGRKAGFYVEVGAADGVQWSNTLMLERRSGWRGLLIEPTSFQYRLCRRARRANLIEQAALTSPGKTGVAEIAQVGLASVISDGENVKDVSRHIDIHRGDSFDAGASPEVVPALAFSDLARRHNITHVDFFSIDVEGFELELIRGIDFSYTSVDLFVIETDDFEAVSDALSDTHGFVEKAGSNDYFFKAHAALKA